MHVNSNSNVKFVPAYIIGNLVLPYFNSPYTPYGLLYTMDFNTDYMYQLKRKFGAALKDSILNVADCTTISSLNQENLLSTKPDDLSHGVSLLVAVLNDCMKVAISAASTIERMKNDQISIQNV